MQERAARLSVFWGDVEHRPKAHTPAELTTRNTLTEFFYRYAWPDVLQPKGDAKRTLRDYQTTLKYWARFTGDPPMCRIDKKICAKFIRFLETLPGQKRGTEISANTIRKHWDSIQRILNYAGPDSLQNPDGAGLLDKVPWLRPPARHQPPLKRPLTLLEIWAWMEACRDARPTTMIIGVDARVWWRSLVAFDYNTGLRLDTLMRVHWEMIDEDGWLSIPPGIIKKQQGQLTWLNKHAVAAIEAMPHRSGRIFPWRNWPDSQSTLQAQRRRLQRAAGIRALGFKSLRESFSSQLGRINPIAAQILMNHKGLGMRMMIDHYLDREVIIPEAIAKLPQPWGLSQARRVD